MKAQEERAANSYSYYGDGDAHRSEHEAQRYASVRLPPPLDFSGIPQAARLPPASQRSSRFRPPSQRSTGRVSGRQASPGGPRLTLNASIPPPLDFSNLPPPIDAAGASSRFTSPSLMPHTPHSSTPFRPGLVELTVAAIDDQGDHGRPVLHDAVRRHLTSIYRYQQLADEPDPNGSARVYDTCHPAIGSSPPQRPPQQQLPPAPPSLPPQQHPMQPSQSHPHKSPPKPLPQAPVALTQLAAPPLLAASSPTLGEYPALTLPPAPEAPRSPFADVHQSAAPPTPSVNSVGARQNNEASCAQVSAAAPAPSMEDEALDVSNMTEEELYARVEALRRCISAAQNEAGTSYDA